MKKGPSSLVTAVGALLVVTVIGLGILQAEDVFNGVDTEIAVAAAVTDTVDDCVYFYQMDLGRWAPDGAGTGGAPALIQRVAACEGEIPMLLSAARPVCPWLSDAEAAVAFDAWSPAVYGNEIIRWPCIWRGPQ